MMDFLINEQELTALCGLPHIQRLAYLQGIRPYMDVKTGITGTMRRISYQSIAEQLYIEPHPGIKTQSCSRAQIRRALAGLERVGIISIQSDDQHLILKCNLASKHFSVQNKAVIYPSPIVDTNSPEEILYQTEFSHDRTQKPDMVESSKADIPLYKENNYVFLLSQFEQFWDLYPEKKSRQKAWEQFQALNPNQELCSQITHALQEQMHRYEQLKSQGQWVASWKYPANWLAQQCWNDELTKNKTQETRYAHDRNNSSKQTSGDNLWDSCKSGLEEESNVINLATYRGQAQAY